MSMNGAATSTPTATALATSRSTRPTKPKPAMLKTDSSQQAAKALPALLRKISQTAINLGGHDSRLDLFHPRAGEFSTHLVVRRIGRVAGRTHRCRMVWHQ